MPSIACVFEKTVARSDLTSATAQHGSEVAGAREDRGVLPRHLQLCGGLDRVVLARSDDAEEVARPHDPDAGDVPDRAHVDREDRCGGAVTALAARADDAPVQHPGDVDVVDIRVPSGDLVEDRLP